jgi:hypothetical protein
VGRRKSIEGQQLLQVPFHAGDRPRTPGAPTPEASPDHVIINRSVLSLTPCLSPDTWKLLFPTPLPVCGR